MKKCIVCEKELDKQIIDKHDVHFCSEECVQNYEEKLKKLSEIVDWNNCC